MLLLWHDCKKQVFGNTAHSGHEHGGAGGGGGGQGEQSGGGMWQFSHLEEMLQWSMEVNTIQITNSSSSRGQGENTKGSKCGRAHGT